MEQLPRSKMDSMQIQRMWQRQDMGGYGKSSSPAMLFPIDPPVIPLHISSFLKLGLQPEMSDRRDMDLQEIYLMLRLQAAAISHAQRKENLDANNPIQQKLLQHQNLKNLR